MNEPLNGEAGRLLGAAPWLGVVWLISALLVAGWNFAYMQASFPNIAEKSRREDLGHAVMFGMLYGLLGPIGVLLAWLMTGFAEHGWRLRRKTPNAERSDGSEPFAAAPGSAAGRKQTLDNAS